MTRLRGSVLCACFLFTGQVSFGEFPYPTCESRDCTDPSDFGSYLFRERGELPNDFDRWDRGSWKYRARSGMNVVGAWRVTTGRPDVVIAVLDSGIRWNKADLAASVAVNAAELPVPVECVRKDCNGDGFVSVADFAGTLDGNGNGRLDGQDLILAYSNGIDDDRNGYVDDIAGWDFYQDDNDPFDDVDHGHGTGQAQDMVAEANNGGGTPGFAPSSRFLPLRVADSFVAVGSDFAQAVVYAVDRRVSVISEALGALTATPTSQGAIDYAYRRGIPVVASAADEQARHHNFPSGLEHTIWVNSIVHGDGVAVRQTRKFDLLNGCTNFGGRAWVAISSNGCSSEATARASGLVALLVSHGKNLVDRGLLAPYPGLETPFSAEEIRQLLRIAAEDIDHEDDLDDVGMLGLLSKLLSAPRRNLTFGSRRFPTQKGWDQYTGYGRPNARRLLDVREDEIPPEADLSGSLSWFDTVDPARTPQVAVVGSAAAVRRPNPFEYVVEVGCGIQPKAYTEIESGSSAVRLDRVVLATWSPGDTAVACGFDPEAVVETPDAHTVTLRLRVIDDLGNVGIDRRTVAVHTDASLRVPPLALGGSAEGSPALVDVDGNGVLDLALATSDGAVHALRGDTLGELPGFPAWTDAIRVHPSLAYSSGEVAVPREAVLAATAADDLEGDGRVEIVVASVEGKLYVFDEAGRRRPGFPVSTDPLLSKPENRNELNDTDAGIVAAPTLVDLDAPDGDPGLEIVATALDGHVYAWRADGTPVAGFPVRVADPEKVDLDPTTGVATPRPGVDARPRGGKIIGSAAVGDLDGDGAPEIVVASNEEYGLEPKGIPTRSPVLRALDLLGLLGLDLGDDLALDVRGRVYAIHATGNLHPGGAFRAGWPAPVRLVVSNLLPTVGTGTPGSPALADLDGSGTLKVAIFGTAGPVAVYDADGRSFLGELAGRTRPLAMDFPGGFPRVPESAGSPDAPFFAVLGSGAFGDLNGDGVPEYVAPTAGLRKILDVAAAAQQTFSDHQVTAWNPIDGSLLPAFPRPMDDAQFLCGPSLGDVDGDARADIVQGSGSYLLRAYRSDGTQPEGWPKFTHGWIFCSPTIGDVDGDGLIEVLATTREGRLYLWDTPAPASEAAIPWQGFGRDRRNTQNLSSDVPATSNVKARDERKRRVPRRFGPTSRAKGRRAR